MQARIALVAVLAALAGAALTWIATPDAGPAETTPSVARTTALPVAPAPAEPGPAQSAPRDRVVAPPPSTDAPVRRVPVPPPPVRIDRSEVQPPTTQGLSAAAMARRDELIACWQEHVAAHGNTLGRFTVDLSVREDDHGEQIVRARIPAAGASTDALDLCLDDAFADARFEPLDGPAMRLLWAVPVPSQQ